MILLCPSPSILIVENRKTITQKQPTFCYPLNHKVFYKKNNWSSYEYPTARQARNLLFALPKIISSVQRFIPLQARKKNPHTP
jgi:hypothetical protein